MVEKASGAGNGNGNKHGTPGPCDLEAGLASVLTRGVDSDAPSQEEKDRQIWADAEHLTTLWLSQLSARNNQGEPRDTALAIRPEFLDLLRRRFSRQELEDALNADRPHGEWFSAFYKRLPEKPRRPIVRKPAETSRPEVEARIRALENKDYAKVGQTFRAFRRGRVSDSEVEDFVRAERVRDAEALICDRRCLADFDTKRAAPAAVAMDPPAADPPLFAVAKRPEPIEIMTAEDLRKAKFDEPRHAITDLIPEGLTLLAGKPKIGKSFLGLHFAMAICSGGLALGQFRAAKGKVLYLAYEETWPRLKARVDQLKESGQADGLHFARQWPRQDEGGLVYISRWVEKHPDTRMVVIDTLVRFRSERSRNKQAYEEDYEHINQLKGLNECYHIAVLPVVHCRKSKLDADDPMDELMGTTGLTGAADTIMVLRRQRGEREGTLFVTGRDVEEQQLQLTFDDSGLWTANESQPAFPSVLEALRSAKRSISPAKLAPIVGKDRKATQASLDRLWKDGKVRRTRGRYRLS